MEWYVTWVTEYLLLSAFVQFAILGTLGEMASHILKSKKWELPCKLWQLGAKMIAWGLLGMFVKYGFTGMVGFTEALIHKGLLPNMQWGGTWLERIGWAFSVSFLTQLFFGPVLMAFHRMTDNLIAWRWEFAGLEKALLTLIWFWLPAHTITFILPPEYRIGLAAIWSLALGIIMGITTPKANQSK